MGRRPTGFKQNHRITFTPRGTTYVLDFNNGKFTPRALEILDEISNQGLIDDPLGNPSTPPYQLGVCQFPFPNLSPISSDPNYIQSFVPIQPSTTSPSIEQTHFMFPGISYQQNYNYNSCFDILNISSLLNEIP